MPGSEGGCPYPNGAFVCTYEDPAGSYTLCEVRTAARSTTLLTAGCVFTPMPLCRCLAGQYLQG